MKRTLQAIKGLPADVDTWDYKPDPKSRTAHEIIGHVLPHAEELSGAIDTSVVAESGKKFTSIHEASIYYETNSNQLIDKLKLVDDSKWENEIVSLKVRDMKIFDAPMGDMFWMLLFDTIHHRGQLSTYYRSMGVRNPQVYGPTAEDMEAIAASLSAKQ